MSQELREKMAVILSGGGAYGAYEVGVMKALLGGEMIGTGYRRLDPDVFTGTSVGSFNATMMVSQPGVPSAQTIEHLERVWLDDIADNAQRCGNGVFRFRGNPLRYLDPACFTNPVAPFADFGSDAAFAAQSLLRRGFTSLLSQGSLGGRVLQFVDISALISVEPFREMLRKSVPLESVRHSDRELRIVATNWETGEVKVFENHHFAEEFGHKMIMASAAIPGIFPPVEIEGDPYVDGGVVMNTPLKCAIQAGATMLHVIYLDPDVGNIPVSRLMNTIDTFDRVYTIMLATKLNEDIATASWINQGLDALERAARAGSAAELSGAEITSFVRVAASIETRLKAGRHYKRLTIHRYHPKDDLGGMLGMLDFSQSAVVRLMQRGFDDAVYHDCNQSRCVFPAAPPPDIYPDMPLSGVAR